MEYERFIRAPPMENATLRNWPGTKVNGIGPSPELGNRRNVFTLGVSVRMVPTFSWPRQFALSGDDVGGEGACTAAPPGGAAWAAGAGGVAGAAGVAGGATGVAGAAGVAGAEGDAPPASGGDEPGGPLPGLASRRPKSAAANLRSRNAAHPARRGRRTELEAARFAHPHRSERS